MRAPRYFLVIAAAFALGAGCSSRVKEPLAPSTPPAQEGRVEKLRGKASYYGAEFHQRKTAKWRIYDQHGLSAAHKTLPFGVVSAC